MPSPYNSQYQPPLSPEREEFLRGDMDQLQRRYQSIAGQARQDKVFSGGVQGASRLNDDPEIRRAVTEKRKISRDLNLARRDAIRRGDRYAAARIGMEGMNAGLQLGGIRQYGADQQAAATNLSSAYLTNMDKTAGLVDSPARQYQRGEVKPYSGLLGNQASDYASNLGGLTGTKASDYASGAAATVGNYAKGVGGAISQFPASVAQSGMPDTPDYNVMLGTGGAADSTPKQYAPGTIGARMARTGEGFKDIGADLTRTVQASNTRPGLGLDRVMQLPTSPTTSGQGVADSRVARPAGGDVGPLSADSPIGDEFGDMTFTPAWPKAPDPNLRDLRPQENFTSFSDMGKVAAGTLSEAGKIIGKASGALAGFGTAIGESLPQQNPETIADTRHRRTLANKKAKEIESMRKAGASDAVLTAARKELDALLSNK